MIVLSMQSCSLGTRLLQRGSGSETSSHATHTANITSQNILQTLSLHSYTCASSQAPRREEPALGRRGFAFQACKGLFTSTVTMTIPTAHAQKRFRPAKVVPKKKFARPRAFLHFGTPCALYYASASAKRSTCTSALHAVRVRM